MTYEHALLLVRSPEETPFHIGNYDFETRAEGIKKSLANRIPLGGGASRRTVTWRKRKP